jgi:RNA polymerase sigma-70 factor (ECF subfamily)
MVARSNLYINHTDEELISILAKGSSAPFNELYHRYGQKMFSYFFRMLWKNKELSEDLTQELFIKVMRHAEQFEQGKSFATWLYSIAHNMCKNEYRKEEVKLKYKHTKREAEPAFHDKNIDLRKFREAVHDCIDELTEEKRTLYILRFQEQLTIPDISRILEIPEGTVKSRLFYLLKEMKEKLKTFETIHITL